jgi:methylated-DNA-protein-cysteine methyltransferase-like protein
VGEKLGAFERIKAVLKAIPRGEVMGYGEVALAAGFPRGARTVVWVLKTCSEKDGLPWHRVVRKDRKIAIKDSEGHFLQRKLLEAEGWTVDPTGLLKAVQKPLAEWFLEETEVDSADDHRR